MTDKNRLELARWVVTRAQKSGADQAAVGLTNRRDIEVEFRERQLDTLKESTKNSLSLDIYAANRYSSHSTNDLRRDALERFIEEAVAMTRYLGEDAYRKLPDPKYYEGQKDIDLNLFDESYHRMTPERRVGIARELEEAALDQSSDIVTCSAGYDDILAESVRVHSNGFEGRRETSRFWVGVSISLRDDAGGRPQDLSSASVRFVGDIPDTGKLAAGAYERVSRKIGPSKLASGIYDMIIENRAAGRLISHLYYPMRGSYIQQKNSFLAGRIGDRIGSDKLTIIDDPFIPRALGSRLYDGEGIAARKRVMVDRGVLKEYFIDSYYGRKLGLEPTSGSSSNLTFDPGTRSLAELIDSMTRGILVTGFIGGNSNSATGDFSVGVAGLYVENGQVVQPISEMNISGNHNEFWHNLVEMGDDEYVYSSWRRPSMYFRDIQFSGI